MKKTLPVFDIIEHTADIGIRVRGKNLPGLCENAALGMFSLLADLKSVKPSLKLKVSADGNDPESLLVNWLNELIYLAAVKKMVFSEFAVKKYGQPGGKVAKKVRYSISAEIRGEKLAAFGKRLNYEIKAATYHQLKIKKISSGCEAGIIFDI